ncbi:MAG: hypothetical protein KAU28_04440, partial [Phycisphaerae bacterium]|nr:hypothetical protein [Phycisphaerae bacterium]
DRRVDDSVQAYAVSPDRVWMAYGVVPQMVISEVYLHSATVGTDEQWFRAIELLNPTDESITGNYRITVGDDLATQQEFAVDAASGERIVLFTTGATGAASPPDLSSPLFGFDASLGISCAALDHFPANDIRIERFSMVGALEAWIPVDSIVPAEVETGLGTYLAERDDDPARQRCLIPVYVKSTVAPDGHSLGSANNLTPGLGALDEAEVKEGFYIRRIPTDKTRLDSVGDFTACYLVGPDSDGNDLPHKLYPIDEETGGLDPDKRSYHNKLSRGRANIGFTNPEAMAYPDVPWGTLLAEFVETVDPDPKDGNDPHTRIFGRININPAPLEVLARLPYPATITVEWQEADG